MNDRILLIAHDYPPLAGGGCPRPLAFSKYLPEFGYTPIVLTRTSTCGRPADPVQLAALPDCVQVERIEPDADWPEYVQERLRGLGFLETLLSKPRGWLAGGLAWRLCVWRQGIDIDRTWIRPALWLGERIIQRHRPRLIVATGPPFASLKVGAALAARFGLPLVADYRDPWTYGYLWHPLSRRVADRERAWERRVIECAAKVLVVTPSMRENMVRDYPAHAGKCALITNGFDDFAPVPDHNPY